MTVPSIDPQPNSELRESERYPQERRNRGRRDEKDGEIESGKGGREWRGKKIKIKRKRKNWQLERECFKNLIRAWDKLKEAWGKVSVKISMTKSEACLAERDRCVKIYKKIKKSLGRPKVTIPKVMDFNEVVSLVCKQYGKKDVLWRVCTFKIFIQGKLLKNKEAMTMIETLNE